MKNLLIFIALLFSIMQVQAQPVPQNEFDTVWTRWTHDVKYVRFSPDSKFIASNNMGQVVVYETTTGNTIYVYSSVLETRFTPDGKYLVGYYASELVVIDVATWTKKTGIQTTPFGITCYDISKDGKRVIAGYEGKYGYGIWDIVTGQIIQDVTLPIEDSATYGRAFITNIYYGHDDKTIFYTTLQGKNGYPDPIERSYTKIIDIETGGLIIRKEGTIKPVFSNDKARIAYISYSDNIAIYVVDAITLQSIFNIPGKGNYVYDMVFSPDDFYLLYTGSNRITVYDIVHRQISYLYDDQTTYGAIDISKDGKYIISSVQNILILLNAKFTGITEPKNIIEVIYPNPADNSITITFNLSNHDNLNFNLYDISGQLISNLKKQFYESGQIKENLNIGNISSGAYYLKIESLRFNKTFKVIINK